MFETVRDRVFPFIKSIGRTGDSGEGSTYSHHMQDALFMMPTARVLANVVDQLDDIDMADRDTKGDLYEYMLGKIATAGQNGQFRTPRHIIKLMVDMSAPTPKDVICDPACGTAGFLVAASEHLVAHHGDRIYKDAQARRRFNEGTFHGYDFDTTMLRIGSMNMLLHGVENPDIRYRDSLAQIDLAAAGDDAERYSLVLANPPFAGSLDYESTARDLQQVVKTKKTELLFLALFLRLLQTGGRAAVIVPDGVLFGSSKAHRTLRRILVEEQKLDAVVSMPSGVFRPYAGVSTAILLFTKTNSGGTDDVWFYDMQADGYSLDDKRTPQPDNSDLADILARWRNREAERKRARTDQSFLVPKAEIASNDYDLSINRYKEVEYEAVEYDPPKVIFTKLTARGRYSGGWLEEMLEERLLYRSEGNCKESGGKVLGTMSQGWRHFARWQIWGGSCANHYIDEIDLTRLKARPIPPGSVLFKIGEAIPEPSVIAGARYLSTTTPWQLSRLESICETVEGLARASGSTTSTPPTERLPNPLPQSLRSGLHPDALRAKRRESLAQLDRNPPSSTCSHQPDGVPN